MKKILDIIKKLFSNKKFVIIIIIVIAIISIIVGGALFHDKKNYSSTTSYDEVKELINNKEDVIIYYFNSNSSNKNNRNIKKYLDELGIIYYQYNDKDVDKDEYKKFLKLIEIDENLFGLPSIIYIKDGKMYGNIINIDGKDVVKQFVDDYDLYTIK